VITPFGYKFPRILYIPDAISFFSCLIAVSTSSHILWLFYCTGVSIYWMSIEKNLLHIDKEAVSLEKLLKILKKIFKYK